MASVGGGLRVVSAVSGATTVPADSYAMVTYNVTSFPNSSGSGTNDLTTQTLSGTGYNQNGTGITPITRYFGPGQSIPSTFTSVVGGGLSYNSGTNITSVVSVSATWTLQSGVILGP